MGLKCAEVFSTMVPSTGPLLGERGDGGVQAFPCWGKGRETPLGMPAPACPACPSPSCSCLSCLPRMQVPGQPCRDQLGDPAPQALGSPQSAGPLACPRSPSPRIHSAFLVKRVVLLIYGVLVAGGLAEEPHGKLHFACADLSARACRVYLRERHTQPSRRWLRYQTPSGAWAARDKCSAGGNEASGGGESADLHVAGQTTASSPAPHRPPPLVPAATGNVTRWLFLRLFIWKMGGNNTRHLFARLL